MKKMLKLFLLKWYNKTFKKKRKKKNDFFSKKNFKKKNLGEQMSKWVKSGSVIII